jgi:hypothetical protein
MYREPPVWVLTLMDKRGILSSVCGTLSILHAESSGDVPQCRSGSRGAWGGGL